MSKQEKELHLFMCFLAIKDEWFCDDISNMSDDMICRRIMGHWIVELSEFVATANSKSIEATKAQISRMKDTYKIPYDRFARDFPRHCVFSGTTNKHEFSNHLLLTVWFHRLHIAQISQ